MKKIINIVSGKGGTGKTMLTAVLAATLSDLTKKRVLVVDMDIFVRGLSSMYYHECDKSLELLRDKQLLSVTDFFTEKKDADWSGRELGILKYDGYTFFTKPFYVMPAVHTIDEEYEFQDIMPNSVHNAVEPIAKLIHMLKQHDLAEESFDYIFLDNRAGYDELVAASYLLSDYTICIDEDDPISRITSELLVKQLRSTPEKYTAYLTKEAKKEENKAQGIPMTAVMPKKAGGSTVEVVKQSDNAVKNDSAIPAHLKEFHDRLLKPNYQRPRIFSILNKVRNFTKDYNSTERGDILYLGGIPYDASIAASFGSSAFWSILPGSLYRRALCEAWNALASKVSLQDSKLPDDEKASGTKGAETKAPGDAVKRKQSVLQRGHTRLLQSMHILPGSRRVFFFFSLLLLLSGILLFVLSHAFAGLDLYGKMGFAVIALSGLLLFLTPLNYSAFRPNQKNESDQSDRSDA